MSLNLSTGAAWGGPRVRDTRNRGVNLGLDDEGNQRGTLSRFAQVFYEKVSGDWLSRPLERAPGSPDNPEPRILEYIYQKDGEPQVVSLGIVEVDDGGQIIRIVEVSSNVQGGQAELIEIMRRANWSLNIEN